MKIPLTYTNVNETGCCAVPNIADWDEKDMTFEDVKFIRMYTRSFLHIPLNMAGVMTRIQKVAEEAHAVMPPKEVMILSHDLSPWKAEQLYRVSKPVQGADNVTLSGRFLTRVFVGSYQNAKQWHDQLQEFAKKKMTKVTDTYFFYTTCPKCVKHYGKNYTIGLAKVT